MSDALPEALTLWLARASSGDREAWSQVLHQLYGELRALAGRYVGARGGALDVPPTALVSEAWAKVASREQLGWSDREHFLAVMASAMRGLLVDHARRAAAEKRGGEWQRVTLGGLEVADPSRALDLLDLDAALLALRAEHPRAATVIELRFFAGATVEEIARTQGLSVTTIESESRLARAWLQRKLSR